MGILIRPPGVIATGGYAVIPPPTPWNPSVLPGLRGRWVPHSLGLAEGAAISSLPSADGVTNTLTQGNTNYQPTYQLFNGLGAAQFDGVNDHLIIGDASISNAASALTLFTLHKHITIPADANYKYLMAVRANTSSNKRLTAMINNASGTGKKIGATGRGTDGGTTVNVSSGVNADTGPHLTITQIIYDGAGAPSLDVFHDGLNILSNTPAFTPGPMTALDSGGSYVGADSSTANTGVNCLFGQCGIIRGVLSLSDRQKLEGYLAWYWGIQSQLPVGHPYRNARPYF